MLVQFAPLFSDAFCGVTAVYCVFDGAAAFGSDLKAHFAALRQAALKSCCGAAAKSFCAADMAEVEEVSPVRV